MKNILAFVQESGSSSFDFANFGTHFIVVSIIVSIEEKQNIEEQLTKIRQKYFGQEAFSSSQVGDDYMKRRLILQEFANLDFHIYATVINKKQLSGEGFTHEPSFYGFLNSLIYNELFRNFPNLHLIVDDQAGHSFTQQFKMYITKDQIPEFFNKTDFSAADKSQSVFLQLSSFIAGTLNRHYDESKEGTDHDKMLFSLRDRLTSLNFFPRDSKLNYQIEENDNDNDGSFYSRIIRNLGEELAIDFLEKKKALIQQDVEQINCMKLFLLYSKAYQQHDYIPTKEILAHIKIGKGEHLSEQYFRSKVIAKLRDQGVLIASSSLGEKKGYKLPTSEEDLYDFVNHINRMIVPMLSRLKKCREAIKEATQGNLDLLGGPEYETLREFLR